MLNRNNQIVDINAIDLDGVTLLHLAALRSETRLFYLIEDGGDPTVVTKKGRNLLHIAARARQANVVGFLCGVSFNTDPYVLNFFPVALFGH